MSRLNEIAMDDKTLVERVIAWLDGGCSSWNVPSSDIRQMATRIEALEAVLRLTPIIGSTEDAAAFRKREDEWYRKYYLPLMEGSGND